MEESKKPKKSWISYWLIALCVFMLLQAFVFPNLFKGRVKEVGYDTFISMTENKEIGSVKIESSQITFTDKDEKQVYQTGTLNDPELIDRLYASGAKFESEIDSGTSPLLYILITCVLPIALMLLVFHFFNKKMVQRMGGGDGSMMFGMGQGLRQVHHRYQVQGRCRRGRSQGTAGGDRGLSPQAGALQGDRCFHAQGCPVGGTSRNW